MERTTSTHLLTSVKIDTVLAFVRKHRGPFAVALLVTGGNLRSTDASKLGTASWKRILEALPQVLTADEIRELSAIVKLD